MSPRGEMFIAGESIVGKSEPFRAIDAVSGEPIEPVFAGATEADLDSACTAADAAFDLYRTRPLEQRAAFLELIADRIDAIGDALTERCMAETGLPRARVEGERGRTTGQLRMFAEVVRDGAFLGVRVDQALPDRVPLPRPDLRLRNVPLGPVAIFGASNFPLAFSVAGGDTASALAAGCPVVVKAHPAHPGTSEMIGRAVTEAVKGCGMPVGVFSMLFEPDYALGQRLVADARIKAVGFTGSRRAGLALIEIAQARVEPIPVYAEMSSINPVLLMPYALAERGETIAEHFVTALRNGAGQFCTSPGLLLGVEGDALDAFVAAAAARVAESPAATMLTPGILKAFDVAVAALAGHDEVTTISRGEAADNRGRAGLFQTTATAFLSHHELQTEIFGSAALVVRCRDADEMVRVVERLEGQLTASIHAAPEDYSAVARLMPLLERKVGRILFDGFGTGVEVAHAIVHGGPFPATSDARTTSVGSLAINRFLRPVGYQNVPTNLLPLELRKGPPTS